MSDSESLCNEQVLEAGFVRVSMVLACRDQQGAPAMVAIPVAVSLAEHDMAVHYDLAEWTAEDMGYRGPFVTFGPTEQCSVKEVARLVH